MDINEIMEIILGLAHSQGFYGRLYNELVEIRDNDEEAWVEVVEELEGQNFKEPLDLILYFEQ
jgi:hypothetical protein